MTQYYFDQRDDSDRDCPLTFRWHAPELAERLGLPLADSADFEHVRNTILTELLLAAEAGKALSFSRRTGFYKRSRYRNPAFTFTTAMRVVDQIVRAGLAIEDRPRPGYRGRQSTLTATPELYQAWISSGRKPIYTPIGETLILRDRKHCGGALIEYNSSRQSKALRRGIVPVNEMLASTIIGVPGGILVGNHLLFERIKTDEHGNLIVKRQYVRVVPGNGGRRVFTEDWSQHGRFYCWPQNISSAARASMTIDGEQVEEIDFTAHHPRLAYSMAGKVLDGDAYDVGGGFERRQVKAALVIAFNARSPSAAVSALARDQAIPYALARKIVDALQERHQPIASALCNDSGIHLMNQDAKIIMGVTTDLASAGIPSIPVHDSVIVPARFADQAQAKMEENWYKLAGKVNRCDTKRKSARLPHMENASSCPSLVL